MADIPSNIPGAPQGAEPMKKSTGKVQPKKETVRINLPPKPSAAPTIKLPTLPPSGSTGVPSMAPPSAAAPSAAAAPKAPAPSLKAGVTSVPAKSGSPPVPQAQQRPASAARPASGLDKILAIIALVAVLAGVGTTVWLAFLFNQQ
jgi:hypothetical protein